MPLFLVSPTPINISMSCELITWPPPSNRSELRSNAFPQRRSFPTQCMATTAACNRGTLFKLSSPPDVFLIFFKFSVLSCLLFSLLEYKSMKAGTSHDLLPRTIRHITDEQNIFVALILILGLLLSDYTKATTRLLDEIPWTCSSHYCDLLSLNISLISELFHPFLARRGPVSVSPSKTLDTSNFFDLSSCF